MLSNIKNWKKIPTETYKGILDSAKVRYSEMMSQSVSITGKMEKLVIINSAFLVWNAKVIIEHKDIISKNIITAIAIVTALSFLYLMNSFFSRRVVLLGTAPKDTIENEKELSGYDEDGDYNEDEKIKVYYYLQCYMYDNRIVRYAETLEKRATQLKYSLIITFAMFIASIAIFLFTNF